MKDIELFEQKIEAIEGALKLAMAQLQFAQAAIHQLQRELDKRKEESNDR